MTYSIVMDSQWLNAQFEISPDKTKAGLAKALGLEPPAVSKILKGARQIKAKEYAAMRHYFGLPTDGGRGTGSKESGVQIAPLVSDLGLHENIQEDALDNWVIPDSVLSQHTGAPPDKIKIFKIEDSLMEPYLKVGEYVLVDLSDQKPSPPGFFVVSDGYSYLARQCKTLPVSGPAEVHISAKNEVFAPQKLKLSEVEIAGRIIAKLQWL